MRQLGNAVPVLLAEKVVSSVVEHLELDSALHCVAELRQQAHIEMQLSHGG